MDHTARSVRSVRRQIGSRLRCDADVPTGAEQRGEYFGRHGVDGSDVARGLADLDPAAAAALRRRRGQAVARWR